MSRSALPLLLLVLLAVPVGAQELPDISAALALDAASVRTGTRIGGTLVVRNNSAIASPQLVTAEIAVEPDQQEITMSGPQGWSCFVASDRAVAQCKSESLAANAQATFRFEILTTNDLTSPTVQVHGAGYLSDQDPNPSNNEQTATLTLTQHATTADLAVHATAQQNPVSPGTPAVVTVNVRNDGPAAASEVAVQLDLLGGFISSIEGAGWSCTEFRICRRATLAAGIDAPITLTFMTPTETVFSVRARVGAEQSFDPDAVDNTTDVSIAVGNPTEWHRILLPVVIHRMPGAYGSLWESELTAFQSTTASLSPRSCDRNSCFIPVPIGVPFRPSEYQIAVANAKPAQFLFTRTEHADKVKFNLRVRDLNRTAETWGTEVPTVRDYEFRTTPIVLMPLPVDPLFRTTLRVYDLDAREGGQVAIHVHANQEATPRATLVRSFTTWPEKITTALLPLYPGYLQVDLGEAGAALEGAQTAWIRVEPLTQGLRFWAFASVTNNPTGHVTTVTPQ